MNLTESQQATVTAVVRLERRLGRAPSYRELAEEMGLNKSAIVHRLRWLERKGALRMLITPGGSRTWGIIVEDAALPLEALCERRDELLKRLRQVQAAIEVRL